MRKPWLLLLLLCTCTCAPRVTSPPESIPERTLVVESAPPEPVVAAPTWPEPLDDHQRTLFFGTKVDPPPEVRDGVTGSGEESYIASNERRLDAFAAPIRNLGGGYVGVGSDQAYLFLGWARPQMAWLIDYDPAVVDIHLVYRTFLRAADSPEAFLKLWEQDSREQALELIRAESGASKRHLAAYAHNRAWVRKRLRIVARTMVENDTPSWLTDAETYEFVRRLVLADRVRALVADLNGDTAMVEVGEAARSLGVPIRVLYLSNAEGYWNRYRSDFRRNIAALPFDEHSLVLRTLLIWKVNQDYRYNVQPALNFVSWLSRPFVKGVRDIVHDGPEPTSTGLNFFVTDGDPDASPAARRNAD